MNIKDQLLNAIDALAINDTQTCYEILLEVIEELEKRKVE